MNRIVSLVVLGLVLAACGDSTDSDVQGVGGEAGMENEEVTTDTNAADPEPVETTPATALEPESTEMAPGTDAATGTDPLPPATETPSTAPPAPEPATTATPTDRIVEFFGGSGFPGSPWAPLGHWDGSDWQGIQVTDDGFLVPPPESPITSVAATSLDLPDGPGAVITGLSLDPQEPYCAGDETGPLIALPVELPQTSVSIGYNAVTADWPLQPRAVRQVGLEVPEYSTIGAAFFAGQVTTAGDGDVVQAVRVDLDGDGVEEVLVTYEHQEAGDFGGEGDFSGVYVRYPSQDGTVVDDLIAGYVSTEPTDFPTPGRFTVAAVADLNGDGVMEVMVRDQFWEANTMQVFALVDGRLTSVAAGGCAI